MTTGLYNLNTPASDTGTGSGVILEQTDDRQSLHDVRNHKYEYDELKWLREEVTAKMNVMMASSTIPERVTPNLSTL